MQARELERFREALTFIAAHKQAPNKVAEGEPDCSGNLCEVLGDASDAGDALEVTYIT
jgi:hypothetical protein